MFDARVQKARHENKLKSQDYKSKDGTVIAETFFHNSLVLFLKVDQAHGQNDQETAINHSEDRIKKTAIKPFLRAFTCLDP